MYKFTLVNNKLVINYNTLDFNLGRTRHNEFTVFQFGQSWTPTDHTTDDYRNEEGLVCPLAAHRHKN